MQVFALGILVVQIAEREGRPELAPFYLGLMGLARAVPGLALTLVAGAVADRVDRRRLLLITQTTMAVNASVLAVIVYLGVANLWHVLIAAIVQAAAFAFDNPSRQSMVPRIIPLPFLPSAIGLQSAAFNGASVIGPVIAGLLYVPIGIPGLLAVNALSFLAIIGALKVMPAIPPSSAPSHSLIASIGQGARYVRGNRQLVWILATVATVFVFAGPTSALLPAVAGESMWNGMSWLSLLLAAMGAGSFAGSFITMNVGRVRSLGTVFVFAAVLNGLMLLLFALTAAPVLALLFAFGTGFGGTAMAGMGNNMLQATTDDAYRGRVMSVWAITFIGLMPIGQLALGGLGSLLGIHAALAIGGAISLAAGIYVLLRVPYLREWRAPAREHVVTPPQTVAVGQPSFR
jgi:MFS family permease